jgi:hypothetical protein
MDVSGLAAAGGSLFSSALSYRNAQTNRRFQANMSNTAYSRAMADMKRAGLNPILAGKMGGMSTPIGAQANIGNPGLAYAQGAGLAASARQADEQANLIAENAKQVAQSTDFQATLHKERWAKTFAGMGPDNVMASVMAALNGVDIQSLLQGRAIDVNQKKNLKALLEMVREQRGRLRTEIDAITEGTKEYFRWWADLFNEFMSGRIGK